MKRILALVLASMMLMGLIPALASAESLSTVKYVVPGSAPAAYDTVIAKVNEQLASEGIQLEVQYIPWDVWDQKINLMLSTGEAFDLFHVMQDRVSYATYYSRGGLMDISSYIKEYGSAITSTIPENVMEAAYIGEGCYIVPANWIELGVEGTFQTNKYLLDKYGKEVPATPAEMLDTLEAIISEYDGAETPYLTFRGGTYDPTSLHSTVLHSTYDSFPFTVKESIIKVDQDGTISSWFESEEFKKDCETYYQMYQAGLVDPDVLNKDHSVMYEDADCEFMHEAYTRGLIDPDVLSITQEQISDLIQRGIYVFSFGCSDYYSVTKKEFPEIDKDGSEKEYKSEKSAADLDMVVLVNENTASASEILTAAIKDNKAGTVIGTKTYGKGVTQMSHQFQDGYAIKLTITEYLTPNGDHVQDKGIEPDIAATNEDILDKALDELKD